ncbi:MAG TPA: hypothetical protein VMJ10_29400 [Kofleriaceae bacterium]|nr:hypothetical protein [Kofleriaceae bacterium]
MRRVIMRVHLASLLFVFVGCATQAPAGTDQLDSPVGKADGDDPSGNYSNASPKIGQLSTLSLSDHTFMRSVQVACAGGGTCPPEVDTGTYLFTHSSTGKHYIRFYNDDGSDLDRYQWKLDSDGTLELSLSGGDGSWFPMIQGGSCQAAGGSCVPLVPDICSQGELGDADQYSCGTGVGVACCLPRQSADACNADSDCSGLLPQFCRGCSDGTESCAHWSCVDNACQITTCD